MAENSGLVGLFDSDGFKKIEHHVPVFLDSVEQVLRMENKPNLPRGMLSRLHDLFKEAKDMGVLDYDKIKRYYDRFQGLVKSYNQKYPNIALQFKFS